MASAEGVTLCYTVQIRLSGMGVGCCDVIPAVVIPAVGRFSVVSTKQITRCFMVVQA